MLSDRGENMADVASASYDATICPAGARFHQVGCLKLAGDAKAFGRQSVRHHTVVRRIGLGIATTVMHRRKIGGRHAEPKLFETFRRIAPSPGGVQKQAPGALQIDQGTWLKLVNGVPENLPEYFDTPACAEKWLQIDAAECRRKRLDEGKRG